MGLLTRFRHLLYRKEEDPILKADTIQKLVKAINERFGTKFPLEPRPGTWLAEMWRLKIKVERGDGNLLYEATAEPSSLFGLGDGGTTPGVVKVFVEENDYVRFQVV